MSLFGFPWLHPALPFSDFHVIHLAEVNTVKKNGKVKETIVEGSVNEQRFTALFGHVLVGISIIKSVYVNLVMYIPQPCLDGVFLYLALSSLCDNGVIEKMALLITEPSAYHDAEYLRKVPKGTIHMFSFTCLVQVVILIIVGFYCGAYAKLVFPFLIILMLPIRHLLLPKIINKNAAWNDAEKKKSYLEFLDHSN